MVHVEDCFSRISVMRQGILYALRSGHPVIDGVGFFIQSDVKWQSLGVVMLTADNYSWP